MPFEEARAPRLDEPLDWTNHLFDPTGYVWDHRAKRGSTNRLSIQQDTFGSSCRKPRGSMERSALLYALAPLDSTNHLSIQQDTYVFFSKCILSLCSLYVCRDVLHNPPWRCRNRPAPQATEVLIVILAFDPTGYVCFDVLHNPP